MYIGTPSQGSSNGKFIYDTGSSTTVVTSNACWYGCGSKYYNPGSSSTSKKIANANAYDNTLATGAVVGTYYSDKVCLSDKLCVNDWGVFAISIPTLPIEDFDGVLGFSYLNDTAGLHDSSFVNALYKAGEIAEPIATFQF